MSESGAAELESARVTRILREDILVGRRAPGSRLVERDIAAELSVSRLPVREAIRALVSEGVVLTRPRSWAVVREYTSNDIQDLAEVRKPLETLIFTFAAQRHDGEGLRRLREVLDAEHRAVTEGDVIASYAAAARFHEVAAHLAANEMLNALIGVVFTRMRWMFGQYEDLATNAREHEEIYIALAARDVAALESLVPQHLEIGRQRAHVWLDGTNDDVSPPDGSVL